MIEARTAAIAAVRQYLEAAFPGGTVETFSAMPARQAHCFQLARGWTVHRATVSFEFLDLTPVQDIPNTLGRWRLAEQMAAAGPEGVLVTEGVTALEEILQEKVRHLAKGILLGVPYFDLGSPPERLYFHGCGHPCRFLYFSNKCCRCGREDERDFCRPCRQDMTLAHMVPDLVAEELKK
jgi:hypothetical protein